MTQQVLSFEKTKKKREYMMKREMQRVNDSVCEERCFMIYTCFLIF